MTYLLLLCSALRASLRYRQHLVFENLALRQQLAVLSRQSRRPKLQPADRLFWSFLSRLWSHWRSVVVLVQPETVIRWQRTASRRYWCGVPILHPPLRRLRSRPAGRRRCYHGIVQTKQQLGERIGESLEERRKRHEPLFGAAR